MANALYYTFSTIAQTLGGAVALLAAFLLYRLQGLNHDIEEHAERISKTLVDLHGRAREMLRAHDYRGLLQAASSAAFPPNHYKAEDERARLPVLLGNKTQLLQRFRTALYLTVGLITFSIAALMTTPFLVDLPVLAWLTFAVGLAAFVACMISYVVVLRVAFE